MTDHVPRDCARCGKSFSAPMVARDLTAISNSSLLCRDCRPGKARSAKPSHPWRLLALIPGVITLGIWAIDAVLDDPPPAPPVVSYDRDTPVASPETIRTDALDVPRAIANNPGSWISSDDYPAEALREGREGTVSFRLLVTAEGRPGACTVIRSSGDTGLDDATCALIRERSRFTPVRDRDGNAIGSVYRSAVRWQLQ